MILSNALTPVLAKGPNNCAIHFLGKPTSYRDLLATSARFSYLFQKEIGFSQRVALIGSNCAAFVPAFFALSNTRSLTIPMDPGASDEELSAWIQDTQPSHVLVTSDTLNRVRDLLRILGLSLPIIEIEKKRGGEYDTTFIAPADNQPKDKDPILLLRTSKTAGKYKYCLFNHLQLQAPMMGLKRLSHFGANERVLTTMNWAHPFAFLHGMFFPILSGAACIVDLGYQAKELLDFIDDARPTRLVDIPDFYQKIVTVCAQEKRKLVGIKSATVGTAQVSKEAAKLLSQMGINVSNCYGLTENLWTAALSDSQDNSRGNNPPMAALVGNRYKVVDQNGDEVEGSVREGQLCFQAPSVMIGYQQRNPEEAKLLNVDAIRGTWLYTGDIFRIEDQGKDKDLLLTFLRRKDGHNPVAKVVATKISIEVAAEAPKEPPPPSDTETK